MARDMATAMAVMYWAAKTDARDVEFVLGSSFFKVAVFQDLFITDFHDGSMKISSFAY
ncbi:hypothetical protein ACQKWADRAFT_277480 [Trichoderma austrokoningii]